MADIPYGIETNLIEEGYGVRFHFGYDFPEWGLYETRREAIDMGYMQFQPGAIFELFCRYKNGKEWHMDWIEAPHIRRA